MTREQIKAYNKAKTLEAIVGPSNDNSAVFDKKIYDKGYMDGALFMCAVMGFIMILCAWVYGG